MKEHGITSVKSDRTKEGQIPASQANSKELVDAIEEYITKKETKTSKAFGSASSSGSAPAAAAYRPVGRS